jgi:hypothetical protein
VGTPTSAPVLRTSAPGGVQQFDVLWNGATTVATWRLLGGSDPHKLAALGTTPWNGYDTAFTLSTVPTYLRAVALDASGRTIGRTAIRQVGG